VFIYLVKNIVNCSVLKVQIYVWRQEEIYQICIYLNQFFRHERINGYRPPYSYYMRSTFRWVGKTYFYFPLKKNQIIQTRFSKKNTCIEFKIIYAMLTQQMKEMNRELTLQRNNYSIQSDRFFAGSKLGNTPHAFLRRVDNAKCSF